MEHGGDVNSSQRLPLYSKVCLINGALFTVAAALLVVSPATVSSQVTRREVLVLACGLVLIVAVNALMLRTTLAPLDRLTKRMDSFGVSAPGQRLPDSGGGVAATMASSFNALLARLESERASSNARAIAAQEEERRRIAQELHDEVGQQLTVVLLGISRALATGNATELEHARDTVRHSLEEVRRIARGLRPGVLDDLGLVTALGAMAQEFGAHAHVRVHRRLTSDLPPLAPETELVIFRVAQEALTNVSRHAAASTVEVNLTADGDTIELRVTDDGQGMGGSANGDGIRGMRERAFAVAGELNITPAPRGGTDVRLRVPAPARVR